MWKNVRLISEKKNGKKMYEIILGNYRINYLIEFQRDIDIELIMYVYVLFKVFS